MDRVKAMAGPHAQSVLPDALICSICQELMFHPYAIGCGHSFCGSCLKHWFTNRQQSSTEKTCPTCRDTVKYPPVLVHAMRELCSNVIAAIEAVDPQKAAELHQQAAPDPGPSPFQDLYFLDPIRDRDDEVLRCQYCMWEVQDGYCVHCNRAQGFGYRGNDSQGESDYGSDEVDVMSLEDDEANSEDMAFINDGEIEREESDFVESDSDAISNLSRRVNIGTRRPIEISDSDSDSEPETQRHTPRVVEINSGSSEDDDASDDNIGRPHMPIVISDSSDVMSSDGESD